MKEVITEISQAKPVITVKGVAGAGCKDLTRDLEKSLGKVVSRQLTPEYRKTNATASNRAIH